VSTPQQARYSIDKKKQLDYACQLLLKLIIEDGYKYSIFLEGDALCLREALDELHVKGALEIVDGIYVATDAGKLALRKFNQRWVEYLSVFDLHCADDLETGEFAMADYFNPIYNLEGGDKLWDAYLNEDRWEDMRVAVAEYKGADPRDIIFMALLRAKRIPVGEPGWEFQLMTGDIWNEITEICNTNLGCKDSRLGFTNSEGRFVPPNEVMRNVISSGSELMFELLKSQLEQDQAEKAKNPDQAAEPVSETSFVVEDYVTYYAAYDDPFYISPVWIVPIW